jgi:hypothetical protein
MQHLAQEELCKWARGQGMRFAGGLAAHVVAYEEARQQAHELGKTLAVAALEDERGRRRFESEEERFLAYAAEPFDLACAYLENLTQRTMAAEESLPLLGLSNGAFEPGTPAAAQAREAQSALALALTAYRDGDKSTCLRQLAKASSHWTSATWLAFLQDKVVGASKPPAYKPLPAADS